MKKIRPILFFCFLVFVLAFSDAAAIDFSEKKLSAAGSTYGDMFGTSVSISGRCVAVGASCDDTGGHDSGCVHVYKREGDLWVPGARLTAHDGTAGDDFGCALSVSGDYMVVGAKHDDNNQILGSGSAYIFKKTGESWIEQAKLTASDLSSYHYFGHSVSMHGDYAAVGALYDDARGYDSGAVYIFRRSGSSWVQQAKLNAPYGKSRDLFGCSVSMWGDFIVVGARYDNGAGCAYVYKRDGSSWVLRSKLKAADGMDGDYFGHSVFMSDDFLAVGSPYDDDNGYDSGSVYIFRRNGENWGEQFKITPSAGNMGDVFGFSLALSGDDLVAGAIHDGEQGRDSGAVYFFRNNGITWVQRAKITAPDPLPFRYLGYSVSIFSDDLVSGSCGFMDGTSSAYAFRALHPEGDINLDQEIDLKDIVLILKIQAGLEVSVSPDIKKINDSSALGMEYALYLMNNI